MKHIFRLEIDTNRIYGLDMLRAAAILFVVLEHGSALLPYAVNKMTDRFIFDGVGMFFVLSGFLIGGILLKILHNNPNRYSLFQFWIRRWFRTLPAYFLVLLLLILVYSSIEPAFNFAVAARYFAFLQNFNAAHPDFFAEAWSLSIEEWFYLLIPIAVFFLVLLCKLSPKASILSVTIAVIVSITYFRYHRFEMIDIQSKLKSDLLFRKQVITRLDSIMYGVIGAFINYYYTAKWYTYKTASFTTGVLVLSIHHFIMPHYFAATGLYHCVFSFSLEAIGVLLLLPYLSSLKTGSGLIYKAITGVSIISYSMYLLNLSIIKDLIILKIPWPVLFKTNMLLVPARYLLFWILTIGLSILLYKYYELPMMKLRDRNIFKETVPKNSQQV